MEKNRTTPETPPPMGANMLARQQFSRREPVERRANVCAVVELPTAYKRNYTPCVQLCQEFLPRFFKKIFIPKSQKSACTR